MSAAHEVPMPKRAAPAPREKREPPAIPLSESNPAEALRDANGKNDRSVFSLPPDTKTLIETAAHILQTSNSAVVHMAVHAFLANEALFDHIRRARELSGLKPLEPVVTET